LVAGCCGRCACCVGLGYGDARPQAALKFKL